MLPSSPMGRHALAAALVLLLHISEALHIETHQALASPRGAVALRPQHTSAPAGGAPPLQGVQEGLSPLRGGAPRTAPHPLHVALMAAACGTVLVLNEMKILPVVLRVTLTFVLSIVFFLTGLNKTTDTYHRPTHEFYAAIYPAVCKKVWQPFVEHVVNKFCGVLCALSAGFHSWCGQPEGGAGGVFPLAKAAAALVSPQNTMVVVGYLEMWCATFFLVSLAGTGSRGYKVPLAEASNVVLILLCAVLASSHYMVQDGMQYVPGALGLLLLLRLSLPSPKGQKGLKSVGSAGAAGSRAEQGGKGKEEEEEDGGSDEEDDEDDSGEGDNSKS